MYVYVCNLEGFAFDFDLWSKMVLELFVAVGVSGFELSPGLTVMPGLGRLLGHGCFRCFC